MYDAITSSVDFAEVAIVVVAIAALVAVALVAKKGAQMVLGMIGPGPGDDDVVAYESHDGVSSTTFGDGHTMVVDSNGPNPATMSDEEFERWQEEHG